MRPGSSITCFRKGVLMPEPEHVKTSLSRHLARQGLGKIAAAAWLCNEADKVAKGRFRAIKFRNGTLTVAVPDSLQAYELREHRQEVIEELRRALGDQAKFLKRFRIVIRP